MLNVFILDVNHRFAQFLSVNNKSHFQLYFIRGKQTFSAQLKI